MACNGHYCKDCKYYISANSSEGASIYERHEKECDEALKPVYAKDKERFEAYKKEQESKHD